MQFEIGSNFWEVDTEQKRTFCFWWENKNYNKLFLKSGRNAFLAICLQLEKVKKKTILFPAYHCHTESDVWYENGWNVCYYPVSTDFSVSSVDLKDAIKKFLPSVIIIQSYFGFEAYDSRCVRVLEHAKEAGCILIEDITQSILSNIYHAEADYYVASLRKFFAIPEGGVAISTKQFTNLIVQKADERIFQTAMKAFQLKKEYFQNVEVGKKMLFRQEYVELNELISKNDVLHEMDSKSLAILDSINVDEISRARRVNYNFLMDRIRNYNFIHITLKEANESCVPLYLPVLVSNSKIRADLRSYLASKDIYCPIIWERPEKLTKFYQNTEKIYSHILCFPIDQRYSLDDMERIVKELMKWDEIR